jgi:hypothetical protein
MTKATNDAATRDRASTANGGVSEATRDLIRAVVQDTWPPDASVDQFGIRSQEHYDALYHPLRHGEITREQLEAARGCGDKLTALVNAAPHNPHRGIEFVIEPAAMVGEPWTSAHDVMPFPPSLEDTVDYLPSATATGHHGAASKDVSDDQGISL